jgi:hypothetical protein
MTIERMSVVAEETGLFESIRQTVFSMLASIVVFFAVVNYRTEYLFFAYPELLLVVLGLSILIGKYTGYRLFELYRFRNVRRPKTAGVSD